MAGEYRKFAQDPKAKMKQMEWKGSGFQGQPYFAYEYLM